MTTVLMQPRQNMLGQGVYSMSEAAWLLGVPQPRVAAWFEGWPRRPGSLFISDYGGLFDKPTISFLDLVDSTIAVILNTKHGVSMRTMRKLRQNLSALWDTNHPFSRQQFFTDAAGRRIFCTIAEENGETGFLEILKLQRAMPEILLPFLSRVEYNEDTKLAELVRLSGNVVLDPKRKYGKPIVRGTGMPTSILNECYQAMQSFEVVADWYSVTSEDVEAAVFFETSFSGIAA